MLRDDFTTNPTAGYRPNPWAAGAYLAQNFNAEPWFTWAHIPLMKRDPAVKYGLKLLGSPYSRVKIKAIRARTEVKEWILRTWRRYWRFSRPRLMANFNCWGRAPGGVEWHRDRRTGLVELSMVRAISPPDATAHVFSSGRRIGQFAGFQLNASTPGCDTGVVVSPHAFWYAGHEDFGAMCDRPPIASAFTPWQEKNHPTGLLAARRLQQWTKAVGITIIGHPDELCTQQDGSQIHSENVASRIGLSLQNGAIVGMSTKRYQDGSPKWSVEQRQATNSGDTTRDTVKDADSEIWFGMGIPPEIVRSSEVGSGYSGRAVPMETWLGSADESAGMWDESFRVCVLEPGIRKNFGRAAEWEYELNSLLDDYLESQKSGSQMPGAAAPVNQISGNDQQQGNPYRGPQGGRPKPGASLSTTAGGEADAKRRHRLSVAAALAAIQARIDALDGRRDDTDAADLAESLAHLIDDPEEVAAALGSVNLSWVAYGKTATGKTKWRGEGEHKGQYRYQNTEPGKHSADREKSRGTAAEGKAVVAKMVSGAATPADVQQLVRHLDSFTRDDLFVARAQLQARFGASARTRDKMIAALKSHVESRVDGDQVKPLPVGEKTRRADGTPVAPKPEDVFTVKPTSLKTDPERFQYKVSGIKAGGVTDELKGTSTYNPELGGTLLAWRDPETGQDYVVNGHHRHELATRAAAPTVNVRYIDAATAKEARARGALANIAEGRGTATDAAKYLRDSGQDIGHLQRAGISMSGRVAADAANLKDLSDKAFNDLTTGRLDEQKATAVARHLKDPKLQDVLFKKLDSREEAGKDWSQREIETAAKKMARAGSVTEKGLDLFGDFEDEKSTFDQEVELESHIGRALNQAVNDYAAVSNTGRAERVKGAGNQLAVEENQKRRQGAAAMAADFDREAGLKSAVSDEIRKHAAALAAAKTKKEKDGIKSQALESVRGILERGGQPAPADAGGSGGGGTVAPAAPEPTAGAADRPDAKPADQYDPELAAKIRDTFRPTSPPPPAPKPSTPFGGIVSDPDQERLAAALQASARGPEPTDTHVGRMMRTDFRAELDGMKPGSAAIVGGYHVTRNADGSYAFQTGKQTFEAGPANKVADHINNRWTAQGWQAGRIDKALARAAETPDYNPFDPASASRDRAEREKMASLPEGVEGVSTEGATRGRVGTVRKDDAGRLRLHFDDAPDEYAVDQFEPLDPKHSWRTAEIRDAKPKPAAKPAGGLFDTGEPKKAPTLAASTDTPSAAADLDPHTPANWAALAAAGNRSKLIEAANRLGAGDQAKRMPAAKILALLQSLTG